MAFEWLGLTPAALQLVQANPYLLAILLAVLIGLTFLSLLCWYISYRTGKNNGTYKPPRIRNPFAKKTEEGKKGNARGRRK